MPDYKIPTLTQRTSRFGKTIIQFVKTIQPTYINKPLLMQIVRSGTSIGANYMEADCGESQKDFIHKLSVTRKEAKETMYWAHMLHVTNPEKRDGCVMVYTEAQELVRIFSSIIKRTRSKNL
ncbi:four helix bundle protein [Candidatus Campbellbacteria bacterium]|nr:MAG: four helix bundle protein [Candidatus Campbellbacteria bacterium]